MRLDPRGILARDFPDLSLDTIELIGEGWDHAAYRVNHEFVFRLPWSLIETERSQESPEPESAEIALLSALAGRLPVSVPEPCFIGPNDSYFGYRYLPGPSLDRVLPRLGPAGVPPTAGVIAEVALAIEQAVTVAEAVGMGLATRDNPDNHLHSAKLALGWNGLPAQCRDLATRAVDGLPERWAAASGRRMVVMHADFGLDHWMCDDDGRPWALIDWSDSCIAPPEVQLPSLMWHVPEVAGAVVSDYEERAGHPLDRELVLLAGYANALGDLGELLDKLPADDGDVRWCLSFLERWSDARVQATLLDHP